MIETVTYTFSFLVSGLIKKDVFNVLEGKNVTLGITSLKVLIILNVVVPLLINIVKQINSGMVARLRVMLNQNLKRRLLESVINTPLDTKMKVSEGDIISLFRNECADVSNYFLEFYNQLPKVVLSAAILGVMFYINPIFAIVSLIPTIIMLVFIRGLSRRIIANRESARKATSELTGFMSNFLGNIEYFKVIGNKELVYETFRKKCLKRSKNEIRDRVIDRILNVFSENSSNMTLGIVLIITIPFFAAGKFTVGEFVMFEYYYAFLASLPDALGNIVKRSKQTQVSAKRLHIIIEEYEKAYEGSVQYENNKLYISISNCKSDVKIEAEKGQIVLIIDKNEQNGSEILQQLFDLCEENMEKFNCKYVSKIPILFDESIRDNICMGESYNETKFLEVMTKTDLQEDIKQFKDGIMRNVGKRGTAISGGQRKRIGIARALYLDAEILFVDGFTDQVDIHTEEKMISQILKKFSGIVFVVSNSDKMAQIADKIVRI
ncbi:MAG: ABC transporter ATP-binding protein/permease [Lachnospiraceae bacterium]|nr:ABC transporter ATP-binding protein/permease [Lachnospiraceae bacterium]